MADYRIQPGDTLSKIAKEYGVTVKQLQEANGIKNPNLIFAGKDLKIPIDDDKAFDIPGLTIQPGDKGADAKAPGRATIKPKDPDIKLLYAVTTPPDDSDAPEKPIIRPDPGYPISGGAKPVYGVPVGGGDGSGKPTILPDPGYPISGGVKPVYGVPVGGGDGSGKPTILPDPGYPISGGVKPVYGVPVGGGDGSGKPTILPDPIKPDEPIVVEPMYAVRMPIGDDEVPPMIRRPIDKPIDLPKPIWTPEPEPVEQETAPPKPALTPEQKEDAQRMGKYTARYLAGYTTDTEQEAILRNINEVNNNNVTEFLSSYEAHRADEMVKAEPFFSQVLHEWGFDEKQDIMKRVALRLATNIAESGNAKDAETIKNILKKEEISEQDARILDEIYQRNLPE